MNSDKRGMFKESKELLNSNIKKTDINITKQENVTQKLLQTKTHDENI